MQRLNRYKEGIGYYKKSLALASKPEQDSFFSRVRRNLPRFGNAHRGNKGIYALGINGKDRYAHNGLGAVYFDLGRFNGVKRILGYKGHPFLI